MQSPTKLKNLPVQKALCANAYRFIDQGISLEQDLQNGKSANIAEVKRLYNQGLEEIRKALELHFDSDEWQTALLLEKKMKKTQKMVQERLQELHRDETRQSSSSTARTSQIRKQDTKLPLNLDHKMGNWILNEILVDKPDVSWADVAGLEGAKRTLQELVILPAQRPDLYTGLRSPSKGVLLFGPPGTGKTLLAKALAHECDAHFFALSASSLVSKYLGDSEKMMRTLFDLARYLKKSVLFFDEIDAILGKRKEDEHEASRRLKTEFLVQFDGIKTSNDSDVSENVIVIGATNRPQELDEAARRRFTQRIFIPLPEQETRKQLLKNLLKKQANSVSESNLKDLVRLTEGYSCSDITALAKEASLYPLRDLSPSELKRISPDQVRKMDYKDFVRAKERIRASVSKDEVEMSAKWAKEFGSCD